jgi:hypothetical protein
MGETLKSVQDIHDDHGPTDSTATFDRLWSIMGDVKAKIDARFDTEQDPSTTDLESYGGPTGPRGTLAAYVGTEIDWMIHSWIGDPETGFTNMHLTAWLGPQVKVPHLGMAWGTLPDLWCYIDLQPRAELIVDLDHLDRYFEPFNERFLELREREDLSPFVSRSLFIRQSVTPAACCFLTATDDEHLDLIEQLAHETVDAWLSHLDEAEAVPEEERFALAARDLAVRRNVAERDPANVMGVRFFGEEMTERLVRALWGADRELPGAG